MSSVTPPADSPATNRVNRYLWVALPLITGAALAQSLMRQGLPVLYPFIQIEFGLSRAQVGLITSALGIGTLVFSIVAGILTDALGVKRVIAIALLTFGILILAFPLAPSFPVMLVLTILVSIASAPVNPAASRAVIDWFPVRIRALAMGFRQSGIPIAGVFSASLLPFIATALGWRWAAATSGLLVLVIAVVFISLYRNAPHSVPPAHKFDFAVLKNILKNRGLVIDLSWGGMFVGLQFVVMSYFMLFMIEELKLSAIMAGGLLAVAQVVSVASRILWGAVSDFVFRGRRAVVLAIIGLITAGWMLGASMLHPGTPVAAAYLIAALIGLTTFSFHGVYSTLIGEQARKGQTGTTLGVSLTANAASMMIAPPVFGLLVDISSSYSLAWRVTAAVALTLTLALLFFGREPQRA